MNSESWLVSSDLWLAGFRAFPPFEQKRSKDGARCIRVSNQLTTND